VGRVQIGSYSGSMFTPLNPFLSGAVWELFDLRALASNYQFITNTWTSPPGATRLLAGLNQTTLGGYQLGWQSSSSGRFVMNASDAPFELEQDPAYPLNDQSSWYVGPIYTTFMQNNEYGGAFDMTNGILYPSPAVANWVVQIQGM